MHLKKGNILAIALLILVMALAACGGDNPAPTAVPAPAATAVPTATAEAIVQDTPTDVPLNSDGDDESGSSSEPTAEGSVPEEGNPTTEPSADTTPMPSAGMVADLGFRPEVNGFSFENYGASEESPRTNLAADDVRRMFGDKVCASLAGGTCTLTPTAKQWMDSVNDSMSGGHCEGFASLSLVFYENKEQPTQFGADSTSALQLDGNEALQREIAYYFATQYTAPTAANELKKLPSEILDILIEAFSNAQAENRQGGETYTMGIYQRGFKGGHAITPYAVEDLGHGKYAVHVYDNNFPGADRILSIDKNANTWSYSASINPNEPESLYEGDADSGTLSITPTGPRLTTQVCTFCDAQPAADGNGVGLMQPEAQFNQVWLDGDGVMYVSDEAGHRTGFIDGKLVNEIPGALFQSGRSGDLWEDSEPPTIYIPSGVAFTVSLDGTNLKTMSTSSVTMIGPGYDLAVDDIELDPGQKDTISFAADGTSVKYTTDYNESPDVVLGVEGDVADYEFYAKGVDIEAGGSMTLSIDSTNGKIAIASTGNKEDGVYSLYMDRYDDEGVQEFGHDEIVLAPNSTGYLPYAEWEGNDKDLELQIDNGSDGSIDETLTLSDEGGDQ